MFARTFKSETTRSKRPSLEGPVVLQHAIDVEPDATGAAAGRFDVHVARIARDRGRKDLIEGLRGLRIDVAHDGRGMAGLEPLADLAHRHHDRADLLAREVPDAVDELRALRRHRDRERRPVVGERQHVGVVGEGARDERGGGALARGAARRDEFGHRMPATRSVAAVW